MIEVQQLTRRFGARAAVEGVTFNVPDGQIVGFLGPNGAGKSTTLKILSGFLPPTSGAARIGGHDVVEESLEARRLLGYMPESFPVHPEMRVVEYLDFRADIKGVPRARRRAAVDRAMQLADITDVSRRLLGELSKGYKQRVGLADVVVARPPLLILDEPTEGLDPNQILRFREVIRELGKEHTIFLSTHILSEVEAVCSHVIIIHRGAIATSGPIDDVRAELAGGGRDVSLTLSVKADAREVWSRDPAGELTRALGPLDGAAVVRAAMIDAIVTAELQLGAADDAIERVVERCVSAGLGVRGVSPRGRSLEDVFHALTTRAAAPESPEAPPAAESTEASS